MVDAQFVKHLIIFCHDDHVVHVDTEPSLSDFILKNVIHHCLKGGREVHKSKEHDCRFKQSFASLEGGLVFVAFFNANIVVSLLNIKFGEKTFFCKVIDEFGD